MSEPTITTAFLGLGAMGAPMAAHLAHHARQTGGEALVWNRTATKAQAHAAQYGSRAIPLSEAAQTIGPDVDHTAALKLGEQMNGVELQ